jgi:uncharacterized protein YeaO (DUF488 family)
MVKIKNIYDKPASDDGFRVFVDRLWPEGISTRHAAVDWWAQEIAPSYELWRHSYDLEKWAAFRESYLKELAGRDKQPVLEQLRQYTANGPATLLYGTSDPARNNAAVVRELLESGGVSKKKR